MSEVGLVCSADFNLCHRVTDSVLWTTYWEIE
jgi:hypothetical protein